MESKRYFGITKWFSSKGEAYGFINGFLHEDGSKGEILIHYKNISEENQANPKYRILVKGDRVSFEVGPGYPSEKNGTQAVKLIRLGSNAGNQV
jgi:cold shock CspA family protein